MSSNNIAELLVLASKKSGLAIDLSTISEEIFQTLLTRGSETEDNLNCREHLEFGSIINSEQEVIYGLKVRAKDILISDIVNVIEGIEMPSEIKEFSPDLTNDEWRAALRMTTMILISIESKKRK